MQLRVVRSAPMSGYVADLEAARRDAWDGVNRTRGPLGDMYGVSPRAVDALYLAFGPELERLHESLDVQDVGTFLRRLGHVPSCQPRTWELRLLLTRRAEALAELRKVDAVIQVLDARERA